MHGASPPEESAHERLRKKLRRWAAQKAVYDLLSPDARQDLDAYARDEARRRVEAKGYSEDDYLTGEYEPRVAAERDFLWSSEMDRRYGISVEEALTAKRRTGTLTREDWMAWGRSLPDRPAPVPGTLAAKQEARGPSPVSDLVQKALGNQGAAARSQDDAEEAMVARGFTRPSDRPPLPRNSAAPTRREPAEQADVPGTDQEAEALGW